MNKASWHRLTLSGAQVAAGAVEQRKAVFDEAFGAARAPRMMALFRQAREDGGVDLFLTPDCGEHAAELIEEWGCVPCERPSMIGLHLLVGHAEMTYYMP